MLAGILQLRRGCRRQSHFGLIQRNEGAKILVVVREREELEETNCKIARPIADICGVRVGQTLKVTKPRRVPDIRYVEIEIVQNCEGGNLKEEELRHSFLALKCLNVQQEVIIKSNKLIVRILVIIPEKEAFGNFDQTSRIILPRQEIDQQ